MSEANEHVESGSGPIDGYAVSESQLRWWLTVSEIIENETEHAQLILRWRLRGVSLEECRKRLSDSGHKGITKERVRQIFDRVVRQVRESMTPPPTVP